MICVLACLALLVNVAQELYVRVNQLGFASTEVKTAVNARSKKREKNATHNQPN